MPSEPDAPQSFQIGWGRDPDLAETISAMLLAIDDPAYISHAELQSGIADNLGRWANNRAARTRHYVASMLSASLDAEERRVATVTIDATIVGFALVEITRTNPGAPFATLHDVVFSPSVQGQGLGNALFDWLAEQCRAALLSGERRDQSQRSRFLQAPGLSSDIDRHGARSVSADVL